MIILGLNLGHADASACLLKDGKLLAAISEERLGRRVKHDSSFPANAIKFVLKYAQVALGDIDIISVGRDPKANLKEKFWYTLKNPQTGFSAVRETLRRNRGLDLNYKFNSLFTGETLAQKCQFQFFEHHLCHIASSYFVGSHGEKALGFSIDGSGDFVSCMLAYCDGQKIEVLEKVHLPHSIGFFYTAMCQFIGFDAFGEEYKVMGLAPYGEDIFAKQLSSIISVSQTSFAINNQFINMHNGGSSEEKRHDGSPQMNRIYKDKMTSLFGPPRKRGEPLEQRDMDIAKSTQVMFEEIVCTILENALQKYGLKNLYMAGGCSLNGVCNAKIISELGFNKQFIQPAAADDGIAVGAALLAAAVNDKVDFTIDNRSPYLGGEYNDSDVLNSLLDIDKHLIDWENLETDRATIDLAADDIAASKVIGWFQGRSEWGPRALGNRSILADPSNPQMKDIINRKIKKRESFRPFAPSVLAEDVKEYFAVDVDSPYMMHVVKFKDEIGSKLPAVTHVDGSGRLQSVSPELNSKYYHLIKQVKKRTGWGIVLNTSFNENEPVVETPSEALDCFLRTDLDVIYINNFRIVKK